MTDYDVVVIGGGFAGATVARELRHKGLGVLLLEARDRLGGRTWTREALGHRVELGGTWVHWIQPHVWAEITRYGLELTQSPVSSWSRWIVDGELRKGSAEEFLGLLDGGMSRFLEDSRVRFEQPYDPFYSGHLDEIDGLSVTDRLDEMSLDREQYALTEGFWTIAFNAPAGEGALTQALRWGALSMGDWQLMLEAVATYKLAGGSRALMEAIVADGGADVQLSKPVAAVEHSGEGATVVTRDGDRISGRALVVTAPLNVLNDIEFRPGLSEGKRAAANEGQASRGLKVWARVRGEMEPFIALAPSDQPLAWLQYEYAVDGDSLLIGFGPDAGRVDTNDPAAVQKAIRAWLPEAEVVESIGHDWVSDEFSRQTWPMLKPNQLTRYLRELQRPEDCVFLAGSDYANGWMGFIDGAIESGLQVSREVNEHLSARA
jgi:monoamine oxidase